jgi:hypothetical protein
MWDRHYWHVAHQSSRDQRRASRQPYRDARRNYRYNYQRRSPFFGFLLVMLFILLVSHSWGFFITLAILGGIAYMVLRLRHSGMLGPGSSRYLDSNSNYQQPNQYYQPYQSDQPNPYYQPPVPSEPNTPHTPPYQPYDQGYQPSPENDQQGAQPYQSNPYQSATTQYEEPQAQYPQEMPPMA